MAGTRTCPACSRPIPPGTRDCPYCGERVPFSLAPRHVSAILPLLAAFLLSTAAAIIHSPCGLAKETFLFIRKAFCSPSGAFLLSALSAFLALRAVYGCCASGKRSFPGRLAAAILLFSVLAAAICNIAACMKIFLSYA